MKPWHLGPRETHSAPAALRPPREPLPAGSFHRQRSRRHPSRCGTSAQSRPGHFEGHPASKDHPHRPGSPASLHLQTLPPAIRDSPPGRPCTAVWASLQGHRRGPTLARPASLSNLSDLRPLEAASVGQQGEQVP